MHPNLVGRNVKKKSKVKTAFNFYKTSVQTDSTHIKLILLGKGYFDLTYHDSICQNLALAILTKYCLAMRHEMILRLEFVVYKLLFLLEHELSKLFTS